MTFKSFEKHQQQPFEIQGTRIFNIIQGQPTFGTNKRFYLAPKPSSQYVNKYIKGTYNLSEQSLFDIHLFRSFKFLDSKACFLLPNVKTLRNLGLFGLLFFSSYKADLLFLVKAQRLLTALGALLYTTAYQTQPCFWPQLQYWEERPRAQRAHGLAHLHQLSLWTQKAPPKGLVLKAQIDPLLKGRMIFFSCS